MRIVNAFKININEDGIRIEFHQLNPKLEQVYGQNRLKSILVLPHATIDDLRKELEVHPDVSSKFLLDKLLRRQNGIDQLMTMIRNKRLSYKLSAHTHCKSFN